jgi:hypothetical protein
VYVYVCACVCASDLVCEDVRWFVCVCVCVCFCVCMCFYFHFSGRLSKFMYDGLRVSVAFRLCAGAYVCVFLIDSVSGIVTICLLMCIVSCMLVSFFAHATVYIGKLVCARNCEFLFFCCVYVRGYSRENVCSSVYDICRVIRVGVCINKSRVRTHAVLLTRLCVWV